MFNHDSRGRVMSVTYPDSERVDYSYDLGGALFKVEGSRCFGLQIRNNGNIMAEHEGKVEQRNIDAIFKGCKIESTTDWKKNRTHHERK